MAKVVAATKAEFEGAEQSAPDVSAKRIAELEKELAKNKAFIKSLEGGEMPLPDDDSEEYIVIRHIKDVSKNATPGRTIIAKQVPYVFGICPMCALDFRTDNQGKAVSKDDIKMNLTTHRKTIHPGEMPRVIKKSAIPKSNIGLKGQTAKELGLPSPLEYAQMEANRRGMMELPAKWADLPGRDSDY